LLTASNDDTARLWDVDRRRVVATLSGHRGNISALAFSPNGRTVATGSADRTVRLWDSRTGTMLTTLTGHTAEVTSVEFYPDGQTLVTSGRDGTVRLWDATVQPRALVQAVCSAVGRSLTRQEWSLYLERRRYERTCGEE
jgi:WD40 repeat protein